MLDLLLINPSWHIAGKNIWKDVSGILPPLGLASIAAFARENGYQVKIIDMQAEGLALERLGGVLGKISQPRFVGITSTTLPANNAYKTASIVREVFQNTKIIFGGHHPTALPEEAISKESVDVVVRGEGEIAVKELLDRRPLDEIDGIVYKDEGGKIIFNGERKLIENIDVLPMPAYDLLPMKKYHPSLGSYKRLPAMSLIASRGCPGQCTFCYRIFGQKTRIKSAENIFREIEYLQKEFGIKEVNFYDDVFPAFGDRIFKFCQMLIKNKTDISWSCFSRIGFIDYDLLKIMKQAGCHQILYGIESADEKILKTIKKEIDLKLVKKVVYLTKKAGINCRGSFLFGNPGETEETIKKTIEFSIELDLDFASFNIITPYPGTEIFEWAKKNHLLRSFNWDLYNEGIPLIELPTIKLEKIEEFYYRAHKKFYLRPHYVLKQIKKIRSLSYFRFLLKGFFALVDFLRK